MIYDLRVSLFSHLQRMSLRFFTNTKSGELMSRLNNDVVNAQTAISDTIVGIITQAVQLIATLGVMLGAGMAADDPRPAGLSAVHLQRARHRRRSCATSPAKRWTSTPK